MWEGRWLRAEGKPVMNFLLATLVTRVLVTEGFEGDAERGYRFPACIDRFRLAGGFILCQPG
jgi:hypothetical protein